MVDASAGCWSAEDHDDDTDSHQIDALVLQYIINRQRSSIPGIQYCIAVLQFCNILIRTRACVVDGRGRYFHSFRPRIQCDQVISSFSAAIGVAPAATDEPAMKARPLARTRGDRYIDATEYEQYLLPSEENGTTALQRAVFGDDIRTVKVFVTRQGRAALREKDKLLNTALHTACFFGKVREILGSPGSCLLGRVCRWAFLW